MKTKTTLLLLGIVVALARLDQILRKPSARTRRKRNARRATSLNFERDNLEGIEIQNGEETIVLRRSEGKWRLEAPIKDQADGPAVANLDQRSGELGRKDETISAKEIDGGQRPPGGVRPREAEAAAQAPGQGTCRRRFCSAKTPRSKADVCPLRERTRHVPRPPNGAGRHREEAGGFPRSKADRDLTTAQVTRLVLKTPAGEMEVQKTGRLVGNREAAPRARRQSENRRSHRAGDECADRAIRGRRSRRPATLRPGRAARLDHALHRRRPTRPHAADRRRARERKGPGLRALLRAQFRLHPAEQDREHSRRSRRPSCATGIWCGSIPTCSIASRSKRREKQKPSSRAKSRAWTIANAEQPARPTARKSRACSRPCRTNR